MPVTDQSSSTKNFRRRNFSIKLPEQSVIVESIHMDVLRQLNSRSFLRIQQIVFPVDFSLTLLFSWNHQKNCWINSPLLWNSKERMSFGYLTAWCFVSSILNGLQRRQQLITRIKPVRQNSFDVNLRIRKDSAIWISITPLLGIEAARVLINRDSLMILDRVHKTFSARDYTTWRICTKSGSIRYDPGGDCRELFSVFENENWNRCTKMNRISYWVHWINVSLKEGKKKIRPNQSFRISGLMEITGSRNPGSRMIKGSLDWSELQKFYGCQLELFPGNIVVTISSATPIIIKLEYNKVTAEEMFTMPFSVPEKYERK